MARKVVHEEADLGVGVRLAQTVHVFLELVHIHRQLEDPVMLHSLLLGDATE